MTNIHYIGCNTTHDSPFAIDIPVGNHWLLVITKTPALFWVNGELTEYPSHSAVLYRPQQKIYYQACPPLFINDWVRFETDEPYITHSTLPFGQPFSLEDPDYCHKLLELLSFEHNYNRDYKKSSLDCLLRTLFNKLLESHAHEHLLPHYYSLLKLRTAIQNNPGESWTVSRMAEVVSVSPGYLQNLYKRSFGISCMDDVISCRIRMAKEYLIHGTGSVAEIALWCGYQNVEHFCRQFKQIAGTSPRNFHRKPEETLMTQGPGLR